MQKLKLSLASCFFCLFSFAQFIHSCSLAQGQLIDDNVKSDLPSVRGGMSPALQVGLGLTVVLPGRKAPSWQLPPPHSAACVKVASTCTNELGGLVLKRPVRFCYFEWDKKGCLRECKCGKGLQSKASKKCCSE